MWWPFKKKNQTAAAPEAAPEESGEKKEFKLETNASSQQKMEQIGVEITKINATLESFKEQRASMNERFGTINEQIGELRGNINDTNRSVSEIEVKTVKAVDLVESVQPDKLMIQMQKIDGKIEAIKANIESNEEMMKILKDQIMKMRSQILVFRGTEQVLKLNEETKGEIMEVKKIAAVCEQHADKVENVFVEMQKVYKELNNFVAEIDTIKSRIKEFDGKLENVDVINKTFMKARDFDKKWGTVEKNDKKLKLLLKAIKKSYDHLDKELKRARQELRLEFTDDLKKAKLMSEAFDRTLEENPLFAKGVGLAEYIKEQLIKKEKELQGKKEDLAKEEVDAEKAAEDVNNPKEEAEGEKDTSEKKEEEKVEEK